MKLLNFDEIIKMSKGNGPGKRGPIAGIPPSKQIYKCPIQDCKSQNIYGYDVKKHFQDKSNFVALDKANEHQSELRKKFQASDVVAVPDEFLKNLLVSDSERFHTLYLFQNGFSSISLPNYNSVGFKCQQKKVPIASAFKDWKKVGPTPGKIIRLSDDANITNQSNSSATEPMEIEGTHTEAGLFLWLM